ncbi:hypothetical protein [Crocosphaera sp.]|uniref:hypothetical protein n=1 Tax=Crocosphaera sp. TaxID=2729996 RepID=UPI002604B4B9|nr:hypothetical protein [Crocosphaera sp.]MDJ0581659.1 hypothetical protein [Crocosphaera sp.]
MFKKLPNWVWVLLLVLTATATTQYFQYAMMGLTVFVLAYLTKGMRRQKKSVK